MRSLLFWDVMWSRCVVTDVSEQPIVRIYFYFWAAGPLKMRAIDFSRIFDKYLLIYACVTSNRSEDVEFVVHNDARGHYWQYFISVLWYVLCVEGTAVAQWLRCCAISRKVAGAIPDGVIGILH